jgi:nitrite reductase/ring-hydroxylating ferredoxin subunit/uncharacterized membrane protein
MLKQVLQGKLLGHPLHVILVHLPIGLFLLSFIFDIATLTNLTAGARAAYMTMAFAVLTAVLAAIPGVVDYSSIRRDHPARRVAVYHMLLNLAAVVLYIVNLAVRARNLDPPTLPIGAFVISLIGVAMLSLSGYLGGVMVYDHGIGVGRHRRRGKTPVETIKRTSADARDGFVAVADEKALENEQSLRVEIDDTVMTVAKVNDQLYAFQEFCTHRYGPLSEGCFEGQSVRCPWHRSCFDMKTGAVVEGPAKESIRVFEVVARDGKVMVRVPSDA